MMRRAETFTLHDSGFPAIDRLFCTPAFDRTDWEPRFVAAMREAFAHHYEHSLEFCGHVEQARFSIDRIEDLAGVEQIPWIFVQNFKEAKLCSVPRNQIVLTLTSSGTQGTKTEVPLDIPTQNRIEVAAYEVYRGLGILGSEGAPQGPCNYLMFMYDFQEAPTMGTAWTNALFASMVEAHEMVFLLRDAGGGDFCFDLELGVATFERFAQSGLPLRVLGFPAFIYHTFLEIEHRGGGQRLEGAAAAASWVLTGGGWKNHKGEVIPKPTFARFIHESSGIPTANVRDVFGMSEHGVGYTDCEAGRLHVPIYAHAVARDPRTLAPVPHGQRGMLHLYSPISKTIPALSLLTTDEVILDASPCPCGRPGLGLAPVGRLGLKHYEGCAIRALEYLRI